MEEQVKDKITEEVIREKDAEITELKENLSKENFLITFLQQNNM